LITAREVDQRQRNIIPLKNASLNMQVAREVQMPFCGFTSGGGYVAITSAGTIDVDPQSFL